MYNNYHLSQTILLKTKDSTRGLLDKNMAYADMFVIVSIKRKKALILYTN